MLSQSHQLNTLRTEHLINENTLAMLVANYESKYSLNPLGKSRQKKIVTARHCLSYILTSRYGLGPSKVGRLMGYDHATAINSKKVVRDMLLTKNQTFIDEIIKWAEVFDDVLPNFENANIIIQERLEMLLKSMTDDRQAMVKALEQLQEKISKETHDFGLSGVI